LDWPVYCGMKQLLLAIVACLPVLASAQTPSDHAHHDMEMRGNEGMGSDQPKTHAISLPSK